MTTIAPSRFSAPLNAPAASPRRSYAHAHWYLLALFAVILVSFWPDFLHPALGRTVWGSLHGLTASLWYVGLITQSWLMSRGKVVWHRRVARGMVFVLLPMFVISALVVIPRLLGGEGPRLPAPLRPGVALGDYFLVVEMVVLVTLGLRNRHTPAAHQRYMVGTSLLGTGPALFRLFRNLGMPLRLVPRVSGLVNPVILVVLIATDWRMGERKRWAYPLMLGTIVVTRLTFPLIASSAWWLAFCRSIAVTL
jgi:hypothetical protein